MEWFKHSTSSHDDPDISDAMDEFGHAGYSVFFIVLELYGDEYNKADQNGWLSMSKKFWERKLGLPWLKKGHSMEQCWSDRGVDRGKSRSYLGVILEFFRSRGRIEFQETPETLSIRIPKFIDLSSNWVKRTKTRPTESLQSPSVAPTAIEVEEEVEEEKNKNKHTRRVFKIPELKEVTEYCLERKNNIDPQAWLDHYTSNGWMVGKVAMRDWKAAIRTWERRNYGGQQGKPQGGVGLPKEYKGDVPVEQVDDATAKRFIAELKARAGADSS